MNAVVDRSVFNHKAEELQPNHIGLMNGTWATAGWKKRNCRGEIRDTLSNNSQSCNQLRNHPKVAVFEESQVVEPRETWPSGGRISRCENPTYITMAFYDRQVDGVEGSTSERWWCWRAGVRTRGTIGPLTWRSHDLAGVGVGLAFLLTYGPRGERVAEMLVNFRKRNRWI